MPRKNRYAPGGVIFHVINRANARQRIFHDDKDYSSFVWLVREARTTFEVRVLAWCVMPNHVHLVLQPRTDDGLSRMMHWIMTSHVQRHRKRRESIGRIWQGRFKAFPVQESAHFATVVRYVERNPLRAGLVSSSRDWKWSSLRERLWLEGPKGIVDGSPVELPEPWEHWVDRELDTTELARLRESVRRGRPFGSNEWARGTAERLGLLSTLKPLGRPRSGSQPGSGGGNGAGLRGF